MRCPSADRSLDNHGQCGILTAGLSQDLHGHRVHVSANPVARAFLCAVPAPTADAFCDWLRKPFRARAAQRKTPASIGAIRR